jgi:hypothetical protein
MEVILGANMSWDIKGGFKGIYIGIANLWGIWYNSVIVNLN